VVGVKFCSNVFWILTGIETPLLILFGVGVGIMLLRRFEKKTWESISLLRLSV
jgi:hypothetical protein